MLIRKIIMKKAKTRNETWDLQEKYEGRPHGWVQWKNTTVDMDIHCKCGVVTHIIGEFVYSLECPACGTKYACNGHIELIEFEEFTEDERNTSHHIDYDNQYMIEQHINDYVYKL